MLVANDPMAFNAEASEVAIPPGKLGGTGVVRTFATMAVLSSFTPVVSCHCR